MIYCLSLLAMLRRVWCLVRVMPEVDFFLVFADSKQNDRSSRLKTIIKYLTKQFTSSPNCPTSQEQSRVIWRRQDDLINVGERHEGVCCLLRSTKHQAHGQVGPQWSQYTIFPLINAWAFIF